MFNFQLAGLDLQSRNTSGRYVPPHLRNKPSSGGAAAHADSSSGYEKESDRGESRGGSSNRGYNRGGGGGRDGRGGDFSNFNTRGRRDYPNGDAYERGGDDWGRSGSRNQDRYINR